MPFSTRPAVNKPKPTRCSPRTPPNIFSQCWKTFRSH
jgi:hypothetical protein